MTAPTTPLDRARAAGYELGEWVDRTFSGKVVSSRRCWMLDRQESHAAAEIVMDGEKPRWDARDVDIESDAGVDSGRSTQNHELGDGLPTLRQRAEEWLGVRSNYDRDVNAGLCSLLRDDDADRDRLAQRVRVLEEGIRAVADEAERTVREGGMPHDAIVQTAEWQRDFLRALLPPEAPDGQ